jgi:hypothetical protein
MIVPKNPTDAFLAEIAPGPKPTVVPPQSLTTRVTSEPADASLAAGQLKIWLQSTAGDTKVMFKSKDASGTIRKGEFLLPLDPWHEVGSGGGNPAFLNSWTNYGSGYQTVAFRKDAHGRVHLKGLITGGSGVAVMFVLPTGYRPPLQCLFGTVGNDLIRRVDIGTNGNVWCPSLHSTGWLALDGLSFQAA